MSGHNSDRNSSHSDKDVGNNISKFRAEGISHDQAVAKALSIAGRDNRGKETRKSK